MNNLNKKKIILSLGTITAISAPISMAISCGVQNFSKQDIETINASKSQIIFDLEEEKWQSLVIKYIDKNFEEKDPLNSKKFMQMFDNYFLNQILADKYFLAKNIAHKLLELQSFTNVATEKTKQTEELLEIWGLKKIFNPYGGNSGNVMNNITKIIAEIKDDAKKFIFKNLHSIRKTIYKNVISNYYLNAKISKEEYKTIFLSEDSKDLTDIQKLIDSRKESNFVLINEVIKQHFFSQWKATVTPSKISAMWNFDEGDKKGIKTKKEMDKQLNELENFENKDPYFYRDSLKSEKNMLAKNYGNNFLKHLSKKNINKEEKINKEEEIYIGYQGISKLNPGKGILDFNNSDSFKQAKNIDDWSGYIVNQEINNKKIPFIPEGKKNPAVTRVRGLMPIFKGEMLILEGLEDNLMSTTKTYDNLTALLSSDDSVYTQAIKYFTTRKKDPIWLEIHTELFRKAAIEHGFEFIKKD